MSDTTKQRGAYSLAEILSQPECWSKCLAALGDSGILQAAQERFASAAEWSFIGCGSSYYIALSAAATMATLTGRRARAFPASDVLLYPELTLAANGTCAPVLISRSGRTSEVLQVARLLQSRGISTLAISCTPQQPLEELATVTMVLPAADEQSTVMTRSFSSMLLALQNLAAVNAANKLYAESLGRLPTAAASALQPLPSRIQEFVATHQFADYVCLGQGPFYGLACECALKVTEMSVSYAQAFHTLEFRHGPKSIVAPETLLIFLLSEGGYEAECDVLEEMKSLGGTTVVIANHASARVRAAADLLLELSLDTPETALMAPYLFSGQLLGLYTGLKKGLDPDSPRNLNRVVILNHRSSSGDPKHATL